MLGEYAGAIIQIFLYSFLHSYYCYEYKTAALEIPLIQSIKLFES